MSKVSVIIPVKNRANLLPQTLDNLLGQSLPPHEIIVVDDHSSDNIRQVIFNYITDAIFLNNEGTGPGAARNLGLSIATGEFIQFFDSDDLMARNKLEMQAEALEKSGADMAYGPYVKASHSEKGWVQEDVIMQWQPMHPSLNLTDAILRGWNSLTQACLFRKKFLDTVPAWDEHFITHEDYLYLFRLSLHQPQKVHVPEAGVLYRQHGAQSTAGQTVVHSRARDYLNVLIQIRKKLEENAKSGTFSKGLFDGRLALAAAFLAAQGEDMRPFRGFMKTGDALWKWIYRVYNKRQRLATGTAWEPMHGVSSDPVFFQQIVKSCKHG
jgi:glycosyltransferase involved in cell wall biosynthesis